MCRCGRGHGRGAEWISFTSLETSGVPADGGAWDYRLRLSVRANAQISRSLYVQQCKTAAPKLQTIVRCVRCREKVSMDGGNLCGVVTRSDLHPRLLFWARAHHPASSDPARPSSQPCCERNIHVHWLSLSSAIMEEGHEEHSSAMYLVKIFLVLPLQGLGVHEWSCRNRPGPRCLLSSPRCLCGSILV